MRKCSFPGCDKRHYGHGLCGSHLAQVRRGHPLRPLGWRQPAEERFWPKVHKTETCWLWTGGTAGQGYGEISVNRKHMRAHRFSWILHGLPEPAAGWYHPVDNKTGDVLDHLCRNRLCVRPDHLESVSQAVNIQRAVRIDAADNVYWEPDRQKWRAGVTANGVRHRKRFATRDSAVDWVCEMRARLHR